MNKTRILTSSLLLTTFLATAQQRTIQVLSATIKDKKIENAEVLLQKNGSQTVVGRTDLNGNVHINASFNDDNNATVIIKKAGYSTLVAKCPCDNLTYAISPTMQNLDGMRIVLSWGASPSDLDAHLAYGSNHIYWDHKEGSNANLDVDDINSYGPETITIEQKNNGQEYIFSIHDYSDRKNPNTMNLSNSQAKVFVYIGSSLVRTYYVPRNMQGNLWTVFKLNANGEMEDINTMNRINLDASEVNNIMLHPHDAITATMNYDISNAESLNAEGENAYHRKDYQTAISYYNQAIQEDPNYGQAYGNLGLAYKKAGKNAEAIWANRKAITLARGSNANVVRAGSYYNIGRIYEDKSQFANALRMYQLAKINNANVVYDKAIQRMNAKM
ncbi:tetratricopeptide repeat protein [Taibaiella lutea]|uniref:Tetratricopeptide repeat protein n=1 Tax=Taibaiella lutea TaxID=2608001 RepID=A0A5M6CKF4_9BACT|nr:tetratricopeptide repeat protein [Taibaiella lutea]KAA5534910.1 tetratricopeptide repeat protein [Taibaiella lutea]